MKSICSDAEILLPVVGTDLQKWAVVACDQFTSQPEYWHKKAAEVGNAPSTLNLILPECFLFGADEDARVEAIAKTMRAYADANLFAAYQGAVLCRRTTAYGNTRTGLVLAIDLQAYDYNAGSSAPIRATEGTVKERIPPRVKIREACTLELPHVIVLADDEKNSLMKAAEAAVGKVLYDFPLSGGGGKIEGRLITDLTGIHKALARLAEESEKRYGQPFVLAVGDGNHSLASAKECYEKAKREKKTDEQGLLKLRYALVEVENIYDKGLTFEPIHRLITGVIAEDFFLAYQQAAEKHMGADGMGKIYVGGVARPVPMPNNAIEGVKFVQDFLDGYLAKHGGKIDYIHGLNDLVELSKKNNAVGLELKAMDKSALFGYIVKNGVLPRKTFSMGEASEKRYYVEARKIR